MSNFKKILEKIGDNDDKKLLSQVHKKLLSLGKNVDYRIFPIYIR